MNLRRVLAQKNFRKYARYTSLFIGGVFTLIVLYMGLDWIMKYMVYFEQRQIYLEFVVQGKEAETLKKAVASLQGLATRQLEQIKDTIIVFAAVMLSLAFFYRTFEPMHGEY